MGAPHGGPHGLVNHSVLEDFCNGLPRLTELHIARGHVGLWRHNVVESAAAAFAAVAQLTDLVWLSLRPVGW